MELLLLILIGLFAGAFSGVLGIGGGLIMIPALVYFLGLGQHQAQATSLLVMLPPITLLSAYAYYRSGYIDMRILKFAIIICVCFFIGSYFGGRIAVRLPDITLKRIFGAFLFITSINMLIGK